MLSKRIEQLESEKKDLAMRKVGCLDSCAISRWSRIQLHLTLALLWSIFRWVKIESRISLCWLTPRKLVDELRLMQKNHESVWIIMILLEIGFESHYNAFRTYRFPIWKSNKALSTSWRNGKNEAQCVVSVLYTQDSGANERDVRSCDIVYDLLFWSVDFIKFERKTLIRSFISHYKNGSEFCHHPRNVAKEI